MPSLTRNKPDPTILYRALDSFVFHSQTTGADETVSEGMRLRGDHEAVQRYAELFIDASVDDLQAAAAHRALINQAGTKARRR